jgi:hypothetical protein
MIQACRQFLIDRLQGLTLPDGYSKPYTALEPNRTLFFRDLPRDFLKDNEYAVACLPLVDRSRKNGRLIGKSRTIIPATETEARQCSQTLLRRRFNREIVFRILLFAPEDDLWGTAEYTGMVEQLQEAVAGYHHILDSDDSVILIEPQDIAKPWDSDTERERLLNRPPLGIVRVQFNGGVQTGRTEALIDGVEFNPQYQ